MVGHPKGVAKYLAASSILGDPQTYGLSVGKNDITQIQKSDKVQKPPGCITKRAVGGWEKHQRCQQAAHTGIRHGLRCLLTLLPPACTSTLVFHMYRKYL